MHWLAMAPRAKEDIRRDSSTVACIQCTSCTAKLPARHGERGRNRRWTNACHNRCSPVPRPLSSHPTLPTSSLCPRARADADYDDDGETQAGARLKHLLEVLDLTGVLVVVTRWFGGIHLGPDRFKHINQAARDALEAGGFLDEVEKSSKKGRRRA